MAQTYNVAGLTPQQWDEKFFEEYVNESLFRPYMGTGENAVIQMKDDLTKKQGDSVTFALVNRLKSAGVTGDDWLYGQEEDLSQRSFKVAVDQIRNAVIVGNVAEQFSAIPLRQAAKSGLKTWIMERTRDDIIAALGSINGTLYADADATARNAWLVDNADRVRFGNAASNYSSGVHATALATLDTTDDLLKPATLSAMKEMAKTATPKIRPLEVDGGFKAYVVFVGTKAMRSLRNDSTMTQANREAMLRGMDNPLFAGADLYWDGMIIKEVEEIPTYEDVGSGGTTDVQPVYLCGAQCVAMAWAERTNTTAEKRDYDKKVGVAISEMRGIKKMIFGSGSSDTADTKDHGLVTGYVAVTGLS